ncbi:type II toxin-antitoxin system RelE/ParE family toxin [Acidithiobacillus sp. M4-SHS-6]|uniref:type II toxin-antitoxin system RelE/ParE family toxin n=1 Tax=Acidithiobacillus sp. M4-SHS-6 TaxID=3383024 RepID=UPI0039BDD97F
MTPSYVLTSEAESDLRGIIRYTRKQWSDAQVRRYITKLEQGFSRLAAGQGVFKDLSELYPALRMARCEHHYVFYLPRENAPALVVAIFHERMELMVRLADRLHMGLRP